MPPEASRRAARSAVARAVGGEAGCVVPLVQMDDDTIGVMRMTSNSVLDDGAIEWLLRPNYWLVSGLEWHGPMAEAALAIAPGTIPRDALSRHGAEVLRHADRYAREKAVSVVFFADLTRTLTLVGTSWADLGVDWEAALADLQGGSYPTLYLTISERAYVLLCSSAVTVHVVSRKGVQPANDERELVRQALAERLSADWPPYIRDLIDSGRLRPAS